MIRVGLFPLSSGHVQRCAAWYRAEQAPVRQGCDVGGLDAQVVPVARGRAGRGHDNARAGNEGHPAVRQRGGAAAVEGTQAVAVFRSQVEPELGVASRAIGMHRVQEGLDLAAIEEVVRTDEQDAAIRQNAWFVVEDEGVGQRLDAATRS